MQHRHNNRISWGSIIIIDNYFGTWHYEKYCSQLRPTASAGCNVSHNAMCLSNYPLNSDEPQSNHTVHVTKDTQRKSGVVYFLKFKNFKKRTNAWRILATRGKEPQRYLLKKTIPCIMKFKVGNTSISMPSNLCTLI